MKYVRYLLFILFILLVVPVLGMFKGVFFEKLLIANLVLQAIALIICFYAIAQKDEKKYRPLYFLYTVVIIIYYVLALIVAGAPIPENGFG